MPVQTIQWSANGISGNVAVHSWIHSTNATPGNKAYYALPGIGLKPVPYPTEALPVGYTGPVPSSVYPYFSSSAVACEAYRLALLDGYISVANTPPNKFLQLYGSPESYIQLAGVPPGTPTPANISAFGPPQPFTQSVPNFGIEESNMPDQISEDKLHFILIQSAGSKRYGTEESARLDAEKFSKKNPGITYIVYKSVSRVVTDKPQPVITEFDEADSGS